MATQREERKRKLAQVDLYFVTSERLSRGRTSLDILDCVLEAGVKMVQLREKELSKKQLYSLAVEFRRRTAPRGTLLIINDHVDVALAVGADGVHLGQGDLPLEAARKIAPHLLFGASSHNLDEALAAEASGADYVNIGPVFATQTKPDAPAWLGPEAIAQIGPRLSIPFTCMGGIHLENIDQVLAAGAKIPAVISAVSAADDPTQAAVELRQKILARS